MNKNLKKNILDLYPDTRDKIIIMLTISQFSHYSEDKENDEDDYSSSFDEDVPSSSQSSSVISPFTSIKFDDGPKDVPQNER